MDIVFVRLALFCTFSPNVLFSLIMHCFILYFQEIFERHRVVFTISTSVASLATAWAGGIWDGGSLIPLLHDHLWLQVVDVVSIQASMLLAVSQLNNILLSSWQSIWVIIRIFEMVAEWVSFLVMCTRDEHLLFLWHFFSFSCPHVFLYFVSNERVYVFHLLSKA